jgi:hypothetical protein
MTLGDGIRDRFLRALVLFGVALVLITESLSAFTLIRRGPLALCWIVVLLSVVALAALQRSRPRLRLRVDPFVLFSLAGMAVIFTLTAVTAAFSPPNSADAMAYHMPRVVYWAEQSSVRFFPTGYFNQIMLQPLAEYMSLQTYVLSGGDRLVNFVQWFASLASVIGVSSVARMFDQGTPGANARAQTFAAVFCATLPAGILASSGAKNDYWMAMWLVAAVYFALCFTRTGRFLDALFLGAALGLALLTKATAYLFAPWPLAAIFLLNAVGSPKRLVAGATIAVCLAAAINLPQYIRNYDLSGSIMGFDSAQGDGVFRWHNESFGWKETASNMLRHVSEQLGSRSANWNQGVYDFVLEAHRRIGIDVNDPRTTWSGSTFEPPRNANHEANAPNRWHLAIIFLACCLLLFRAIRRGEREMPLYVLALLIAFVAFCAYLKWQPFMARILLPLFVLAAPLVAGIRPCLIRVALCLFLFGNARLPLIENWVRPLIGPHSVFRLPRDVQYFADMNQWNNQASYRKTVDLIADAHCETVGIDITNLQLEYPLQALLREKEPNARFLHTGVQNASSRFPPPVNAKPCAVVCLDCRGDPKRLQMYADLPGRVDIDRFVVFMR